MVDAGPEPTYGEKIRVPPLGARRLVVPDLGPICLQRLWADDTSRQRVNPWSKKHSWNRQFVTIHMNIKANVNNITYPLLACKNWIWNYCLLESSAAFICLPYWLNVSIEANSVDPDQTAPTVAVWSGSKLFVGEVSKTFKQMKKQMTFVVIGALRVNSICCKYMWALWGLFIHCILVDAFGIFSTKSLGDLDLSPLSWNQWIPTRSDTVWWIIVTQPNIQ